MTVAALLVSSIALTGVPHDAVVDRAWFIPRTRTEPRQLLVEWHRRELVAPKGGRPYPNVVWRLVLLTGQKRQVVLTGPSVLGPIEEIRLADVTGDEHLDVLLHDVQGNHWCGPTKVVATVRSRLRTVFAADWCETSWRLRRGVLHVDEPRGGRSVCCPSHRLLSTYRWNGRRLVVARSRLVPVRRP